MDDFCKELEKMVKAGIGAVATGMEKAQEAVEYLAQKGEPLYDKARDAVSDAAEKVTRAFNEIGKPRVENFLHDARSFTLEELKELRDKLDLLITDLEEKQKEDQQIVPLMEEPAPEQPTQE